MEIGTTYRTYHGNMSSNMRILQLIETGGPGGAETIVATLSERLIASGHDVSVIVGPGEWLARRLRKTDIPTAENTNRGFLDFLLIRQIRMIIRDRRIDVVHGHLFGSTVYACLATLGTGVPVIGTLHGHADLRERGIRLFVKGLILRAKCRRLVSVSQSLSEHATERLHFPRRRSAVVFNGVAVKNSEYSGGEVKPLTTATALTDERLWQIGAIGNVRVSKDYPSLIKAFAVLKTRMPNVHLRIAGAADDSGLLTECMALANKLGVSDEVEFLGFVEDPSVFIGSCDLFVLSSAQEGFSLATVEAMIAGTPIVATRSGGPEEIIRDGENGRLVPVNNHLALAVGMEIALREQNRSVQMARTARQDAMDRFTVEKMIEGYLDLYHAVIAGSRKVG